MSLEFKANIKDIKTSGKYIGFLFKGFTADEFYSITCPCGETVKYPLNGLPEVDTPMSCGNPNHWAVKYEK